jgi:hypothetical protein
MVSPSFSRIISSNREIGSENFISKYRQEVLWGKSINFLMFENIIAAAIYQMK